MRSLTVLLAEDDPVISLDIRCLLEEKGLQVVQLAELGSITQACEQFQPDFAILNFKQQNYKDGMAAAQALKQCFPLPVLLVTGARPQDIAGSKDFDPGVEILYKPFTRTQLRACVYRCTA